MAATPGDIRPFLKWAAIIVGLVVLFGLVSFGRSVYTDLLWFDSLDLRSIFVKVTVTRIALFAIGTAVAAVAIGVSLWLAYRPSAGEITLPVPSEVLTALRRSVTLGSIAAVIVLSLILGSVLAARWELFLKFTNSVPFNQNDPVYGLDLGFYIFNLPFYSFVQGWVLGLFIVVLLATIALHFINYSMRGVGYELNGPRLIHLSIIAAVIMLAMGVGHWLDPMGAGACLKTGTPLERRTRT